MLISSDLQQFLSEFHQ